MPLTITDNRITPHEFDSTTGLSSPVAVESLVLFTADPDPKELSGSVGMAVSIQTSDIVVDITSTDLTNTLVYVWILANGTMDTLVNGGIGIVLGDGTNIVGYHLAGSDIAGFRHADGQVGWQCLLLDTSSLPPNSTQLAGTGLTITAITQIGAFYTTLSKALGGASNCFTDVVRYGNGGITLTAGTSGSQGTFVDISSADSSNTSGQAYGAIRELGTDLYGLQASLTFGDNVGTTSTWFEDIGSVVVFEERSIGTDKYFLKVVGNGTGTTDFILGNKTGIGDAAIGSGGATIKGAPWVLDTSDTNITNVKLYGCNFSNFLVSTISNSLVECISTSFDSGKQLTIGIADIFNSKISNTTETILGALLLPIGNTHLIRKTSFENNERAVEITAAGTYDFADLTFSGNTYDIVNSSGGAVTINLTGTSNAATAINTSGGSVTFVASYSLLLTNIPTGVNVTIVNSSTRTELQHTTSTGANIAYVHSGGETVDILLNSLLYDPNLSDIYDLTLDNADQSVKFNLLADVNYDNP